MKDTDLLDGLLPVPVSFTTVALIVLAALAAIAFARGVLRIAFGTAALGVGCAAAYFVYVRAPEFTDQPRHVLGAALAAGVGAWLAARYLVVGLLLRPVLGKHRGPVGKAGALISLAPAAFVIWALAAGLRLTGTVMEMDETGDNVVADEGAEVRDGWLAHWREALDNDPLARLLARADPFVQRGRAALAQLLITGRDAAATEAIADHDPEARAIIESPAVRELRDDPEIRVLVKGGDYVALVQHPKVRRAMRERDLARRLEGLDLRATLDRALYSEGSGGRPKVRRRIPRRLWRSPGEGG